MAPTSDQTLPWKARIARWADPGAVRQHEDKVLLLLTLIIGAIVGLVVVAFILLTENLGARLYPAHGAAWRRLVMPVAGALLTGFLLSRYFPNARGSGIPQTKTALFIRDGYISFRTLLGKFSLSTISLASGIALGREGPSVQVSCGIASVLGRKLGLSPTSVKALLPVGASAALAAAFNTPIAAVLFTLEEVMGDMHAPVLGSIVLSSATAWIVLHLLLGDEPLFHVPSYQLVNPLEFLIYAVLGVAGGLVSAAFVKLLLWQRKRFLRMPKSNQWWQPAVGGLLVGVLGWFFPDVLGVGYGVVSQALNGELVLRTMALLVALKLVATATCYASGNAGGIFGPSLFIGAMIGGAVGQVAHHLLPGLTAAPGAYALVGMGTLFAGFLRVPMTSVFMVLEVSGNYSIILPVIISNTIAYVIGRRFQATPIFDVMTREEGLDLPSMEEGREQTALLVENAMRKPVGLILKAGDTVADAVSRLADMTEDPLLVSYDTGRWTSVTKSALQDCAKAGKGGHTLAQILPAGRLSRLHPDQSLDLALRLMRDSPFLPVVHRADARRLVGLLALDDILAAYRRASIIKSSAAE